MIKIFIAMMTFIILTGCASTDPQAVERRREAAEARREAEARLTPKQRCLAGIERQDGWCRVSCISQRTAVCYQQCDMQRLLGMAGCTAYD